MRIPAFLLLIPAAALYAQSPAPAAPAADTPAAAAPAAPAEKTAEQTASPDLVKQLAGELAITPAQAEGAAGTMFGIAKGKLTAEEFGKVAGAVPNMDGLLKAAPAAAAAAKATPLDALAGKASAAAGGVGAAAAATASLSKLGLKPETIVKLAPAMVKAVEAKGGAEVGAILAKALK